jgi:hypothetical protein
MKSSVREYELPEWYHNFREYKVFLPPMLPGAFHPGGDKTQDSRAATSTGMRYDNHPAFIEKG